MAMRSGILIGYEVRAFPCAAGAVEWCSRWMPAAAATAEAVAEVHRERSWKNQRWKTLEEPAMQDAGRTSDELAQTMGDPPDARATNEHSG